MSSAAWFTLLLSLAMIALRGLAVRAGSTSVDSYMFTAEKIYHDQKPKRLVQFSNLSFETFGGLGYRQLPYNHRNLTWVFAVSVCDNYPYFSTDAVVMASNKYHILTPGLECAGIYRQVKGTKTGAISEWGQEFSAMDYINFPTALCVHHPMVPLDLSLLLSHLPSSLTWIACDAAVLIIPWRR